VEQKHYDIRITQDTVFRLKEEDLYKKTDHWCQNHHSDYPRKQIGKQQLWPCTAKITSSFEQIEPLDRFH
jgi:hypothetical protein